MSVINTDGSVTSRSHQICFKDVSHGERATTKLEFEGVPFMIVGSKLMECHQGPQRRRPVQRSEVRYTTRTALLLLSDHLLHVHIQTALINAAAIWVTASLPVSTTQGDGSQPRKDKYVDRQSHLWNSC